MTGNGVRQGTSTWNSDPKRAGSVRGANGSDAMTEACAECGDPVPAEEWHPVATHRDDDGEMDIYAFCSESCRASWQADFAGDD